MLKFDCKFYLNNMDLKIGDIFYIKTDDKYYVYKLLRQDADTGINHVLVYEPFESAPDQIDFQNLEVLTNHIPIDTPKEYKVIGHSDVTEDELQGFYDFLKLTDFARYLQETGVTIEEVINTANAYFQEADNAYKTENYTDAIENYTAAIETYPLFFEAIDRRAFTKMAMGEFLDAIKDFEFSLMVNPNSVIAEFAIGECYYKLGDYQAAVDQFEHTAKLFPDDDLTIEWLELSKRELAQSQD